MIIYKCNIDDSEVPLRLMCDNVSVENHYTIDFNELNKSIKGQCKYILLGRICVLVIAFDIYDTVICYDYGIDDYPINTVIYSNCRYTIDKEVSKHVISELVALDGKELVSVNPIISIIGKYAYGDNSIGYVLQVDEDDRSITSMKINGNLTPLCDLRALSLNSEIHRKGNKNDHFAYQYFQPEKFFDLVSDFSGVKKFESAPKKAYHGIFVSIYLIYKLIKLHLFRSVNNLIDEYKGIELGDVNDKTNISRRKRYHLSNLFFFEDVNFVDRVFLFGKGNAMFSTDYIFDSDSATYKRDLTFYVKEFYINNSRIDILFSDRYVSRAFPMISNNTSFSFRKIWNVSASITDDIFNTINNMLYTYYKNYEAEANIVEQHMTEKFNQLVYLIMICRIDVELDNYLTWDMVGIDDNLFDIITLVDTVIESNNIFVTYDGKFKTVFLLYLAMAGKDRRIKAKDYDFSSFSKIDFTKNFGLNYFSPIDNDVCIKAYVMLNYLNEIVNSNYLEVK